jgi:glycosyltransferase involved in cell wall biosynthesis
MRIGYTTYPIAFQRRGGLEVQIRETAAALQSQGHDVRIVELYSEKLCDYDLIHHFSIKHGSVRILQYARACGIPVVATPLIDPLVSPLRLGVIGLVRRLLHRIFGHDFSGYWDELDTSLRLCDALFPLTERERTVIRRFQPAAVEKCVVVPNGVTARFFAATPDAFLERFPVPRPFLLLPSSVEGLKNQATVIREAASAGIHSVMLGPIIDREYHRSCMALGGNNVTYLGELPYQDPLLVSAFAAADCVVLLSSRAEAFGLVPFEALAAGTPSILTTCSGVDTESQPPFFFRVPPSGGKPLRAALEAVVRTPRNREACRRLVEPMQWGRVAATLAEAYGRLAIRRPSASRA